MLIAEVLGRVKLIAEVLSRVKLIAEVLSRVKLIPEVLGRFNFQGRIFQGMYRPSDISYKGRNIQEQTFGHIVMA